MITVQHRFHANCPPEILWDVLSDLERVAITNPLVKSVRLNDGASRGVGASRTCELVPKGAVVERVTEWREFSAVGMEVVQSDWPIHFMRWVTVIAPAEGGSKVTQELEYKVKFGPFGWLLNKLVMQRMLQKNVGAALEGMITHAEDRRAKQHL